MICFDCKREFANYIGLTTHCARVHSLSIEDSYVKYRLGGTRPVCGYNGCQTIPYFKGSTRGYAKHCSKHRGKWQEGLTAKTDGRIQRRGLEISKSLASGKHWAYRDPVKRAAICARLSAYRRSRRRLRPVGPYDHMSKGQTWARGLTKYTDPRIAKIGVAVKAAFVLKGHWARGQTKHTHAGLMKLSSSRRLEITEVKRRLEARATDFSVITSLQDYEAIAKPLNVKCNACGREQRKTLVALSNGSRCSYCFPQGFSSKYQDELLSWIKSNGFFASPDRTVISPFEIDAYVPGHSFGVEMNGIYWHSEKAGRSSKSHQLKTDMCAERGIRLLHVFEDEWRDKKDIVKSMVGHVLGMSTAVYARTCKIDLDPPKNEITAFINRCHIDGNVSYVKAFALRDGAGQIVSAMTLRRPIHVRDDQIEMARFCSELNTSVVGGLSKLLKHVIEWSRHAGYKELLTYADQRLGKECAYEKLGFRRMNDTVIRFWWTDFDKRFNRFKFRAQDGRRQADVAADAGMTRIWGCRNSKFAMSL